MYLTKEYLIKMINESIPDNAIISITREVETPDGCYRNIGTVVKTHAITGAINIGYKYSFNG